MPAKLRFGGSRGHADGGGGHGSAWVVSFADLMSLLMAFFVMLLSFSIQDQEKLNQAASSVQNAFNILPGANLAGILQRTGTANRDYLKPLTPAELQAAIDRAAKDHAQDPNLGQEANTYSKEKTDAQREQDYALAAASLRQAWQDQPDITAVSDHIILENTPRGLNIVLADQAGRAMFPDGSKYPYESTRRAIAAMAPSLQKLPNQIQISGHTSAGGTYDDPQYGPWELSFDRANVVRQLLEEYGVTDDRIQSVVGRGAADPFFPNEPYLSSNQRVSILLVNEPPPVPVGLKP